jgi:hypothetical protein
MNIASRAAPEKPRAASPHACGLSNRLCELAHQVERLALGGRTDPEQIVLGKLAIAGELRELARGLR